MNTIIIRLGITIICLLLPVSVVNSEVLDIEWEKVTDTMDYQGRNVEYLSRMPGQPDILKNHTVTTYSRKNGIPAIILEGNFYADLDWLNITPTVPSIVDYGLGFQIELPVGGMIIREGGSGNYGKIDVKSNSVLTLKPLFPDKPESSAVKASGKLECLFVSGSMFTRGFLLPLFFVEGSKVTLVLKKGELIEYSGKTVRAQEDTEILFEFDSKGKPQERILKGSIQKLK